MGKNKEEMDILIESLEFPDKAIGVELLPVQRDAVDQFLEIETSFEKRPKGREIVGKGGLPGQVYRARKKRNRSGRAEVDFLGLLKKSPLEVPPQCAHFEECGGCSYQNLSYDGEVLLKNQQLRTLFDKAGFHIPVPLRRSPRYEGYRNKMEYTFGDQEKDGALTLGLHSPGHYYDIVPTPDCRIVPADFNTIRKAVERFFRQKNLSYYRKQTKKGLLRYCILRAALSTGQLMVNLVTTSEPGFDEGVKTDFIAALLQLSLHFPLVSIYHTLSDSPSDAVVPENVRLLWGRAAMDETLCGLTFKVGPFSFFQPNIYTAELLYERALELAGDLEGKHVFDLYCGTGTLTQLLAKKAQRVVGIEINEEAIEMARKSAEINEIPNIQFIAGDVLDELDRFKEKGDRPDLLLIDPPRSGIHPKALEKMIETQAPKIIYISCNPKTQIRDLVSFQEGGYEVKRAQAMDQFPKTRHVETIALMQKM